MKIFFKLLTLWAFLINSAFGQGDPAPFIKGMGSTGLGNSASTIYVPNNQSTKINAYQALIETGNSNLLTNSGFEHSTPSTGWTITNATASTDTTNQVEGKKALSLSLTGALSVTQDSTINAANLVGLQGNASIKIKTSDVDGLKVCARNAGVTSTSLCVNIPKDGVWKEINIPYILTATSNGIAITSTGTSGTVKLDDSFVGTSAPFQNVNGAKLVGGVIITGCAGRFQTTSTTFASFGTQTGCVYTTFGQAIQPSVTNLPVIKFASLPAGDYVVEYSGAIFNATNNNNTWVKFHDGTNYMREEPWLALGTSGGGAFGVSGSFSYSTAQSNITFEARSKIQNGTGNLVGSSSEPGVIKVFYYPPESKIYSQASQDYAYTNTGTITIGATTTAPTKGTIVTDRIMASRKGQNLKAIYQYKQSSLGTTGSGNYLLTLPSGLSFDTSIITPITSSAYTASDKEKAYVGSGSIYYSSGEPAGICSLYAYDSTRFQAWCINGSTGFTVVAHGWDSTNLPFNTATGFTFNIDAPIQGWQDYGVIVGSFAEVTTSPGNNNNILFSGQISSTAVLSNQIGGTTSSCTFTTTGVLNCTVPNGRLASAPNCSATCNEGNSASQFQCYYNPTSSSATNIQFITTVSAGSTLSNRGLSYVCQGLKP